MEHVDLDNLVRRLIHLSHEIARGQYSQAEALFALTNRDAYPQVVAELAEALGMMAVKVEAREYRLEQIIDELRQKNVELEATLHKVKLLETIKVHLGKFVPEAVKHLIEAAPEAPDLDKHDQDVTVLFLDIAGYTHLSETVEAPRMNALIERYFSSFLDDIYQNQGDINETAGDGLMIIFQNADPVQHARNAVRTALAVQRKVQTVNQELAEQFEPIVVNIGINSGLAAVGSTRFEGIAGTRWTFTASGPVTNVAARIGKLATRGEIFAGEETARRIRGEFALCDLGEHHLKNVGLPVRVHQVMLES
jgi:class 3 adenylate cyclase